MALAAVKHGPVAAPEHERDALVALDRLLETEGDDTPKLIGSDGEKIELPETVVRALRQVVHAMARDRAVTVVPVDKQLTTQQAADVLNVSRPYLIQLLDEGELPHTKTGTHRRIRLDDVMAYRERRDRERMAALDYLSALGQATGKYFEG
jgi:excisionase family DNA binding protein